MDPNIAILMLRVTYWKNRSIHQDELKKLSKHEFVSMDSLAYKAWQNMLEASKSLGKLGVEP